MPPITKDTVSNMIRDAVIDKDGISGIVEDMLGDRDNRIASLERKLGSLESEYLKIGSENMSLRKSINHLSHEMNRTTLYIEQLKRVTDDQNQYSRKQNIIIDGLKIKSSDKDDRIRNLVLAEIRHLNLDIDEYEVDRAHRTDAPYHDKNGKLHTPVIVRFTSWYARNEMYEARKKSNLFMKADLTARRKDLLNDAREFVSEGGSRVASLIEFVFADRNCQLSVKAKDGRFFKFNSLEEFRSLLDYIEDTRPPDLSNLYTCYQPAWHHLENAKEKEMEPAVVNLHTIRDINEWLEDDDHVYIGREHGNIKGSPWGNPFRLNDYDVETSLRLYEEHITSNEALSKALGTLKKKSLACWCENADQCHSSVLLRLIGI